MKLYASNVRREHYDELLARYPQLAFAARMGALAYLPKRGEIVATAWAARRMAERYNTVSTEAITAAIDNGVPCFADPILLAARYDLGTF